MAVSRTQIIMSQSYKEEKRKVLQIAKLVERNT